MTKSHPAWLLWRRISLLLLALAAPSLVCASLFAQVADRIAPGFSTAQTSSLKNSLHPLARPEYDQGRASGVTKVPYMTLAFAPSAAQKAALTTLLADQQNPASPSYHKWLTPEQYAARFGMSANDLATAEAWLEAQGFVILDVPRSRDAIHFSGTVAQVEAALHTEMHQYLVDGTTHLANSTALALPSSLAGTVGGIRGLAQFRPHAMHTPTRRPSADKLTPQFTSSISGDHYLAPNDVTTIYDIKALYSAGYDGTGQSIAIIGQSAIATTDLDAFRAAAGLAAKEPVQVLVPNTGASTIVSGDEDESDIDLEYSNAIAYNATVNFIYAGATGSVFDALAYAIDNDSAPIVSLSYGECELDASSDATTLEPEFMKANAQGQTILASSGDEGATGCDFGTSATRGLAVGYPASSAYLTAMGGTEFNEGTGTYWNTANDAGGGSATSYIPEAVWNETAASNALSPPGGLSSGGGGVSILFGKPTWQVGTGVPADGGRDVPDISLDAASLHDGYLYCAEARCVNGFRDNDANTTLTVAGGTSFDAPIFAGILALINQKNNATGAGNINPTLYALASTAPTAFHDITTGDNEQPCTSGSIDCATGTAQIGYAAGVGYDLASGLGSIDANMLAGVFPATPSLTVSDTTLTVTSSAPVTGTPVTFSAGVSAGDGAAVGSGTVNFSVDGEAATAEALSASGVATFSYTFATTGSHTVVATYTGSTTNAASSANLTFTVASATSTGSFTLTASNVTVTSGNSATSTLTVTGANGYGGTVGLSYSASTGFTGCLFANLIGVGVNGTVSTTITVDTLASDCVSSGTRHLLRRIAPPVVTASTKDGPGSSGKGARYPAAAAALLAGVALLGRRRKAWPAAMVLLLAGLGVGLTGLTGCGGSSGTSTPITPSTTYTIQLTGADTLYPSLTASASFTVTVQQ
jgi:subtilase family serine protease